MTGIVNKDDKRDGIRYIIKNLEISRKISRDVGPNTIETEEADRHWRDG